jgi:hypothetical protein
LITENRPEYSFASKNWLQYYYHSTKTSYYIDLSFMNFFYVLEQLVEDYSNYDITIKGGFVVFYAIDDFAYDNLIKHQKETYSIRLDNPISITNFVSSIEKPLGFFSHITADTTRFTIPYDFIKKFFYRDGQ